MALHDFVRSEVCQCHCLEVSWLCTTLSEVCPGHCLEVSWLCTTLSEVCPGHCLEVSWLCTTLSEVCPGHCSEYRGFRLSQAGVGRCCGWDYKIIVRCGLYVVMNQFTMFHWDVLFFTASLYLCQFWTSRYLHCRPVRDLHYRPDYTFTVDQAEAFTVD